VLVQDYSDPLRFNLLRGAASNSDRPTVTRADSAGSQSQPPAQIPNNVTGNRLAAGRSGQLSYRSRGHLASSSLTSADTLISALANVSIRATVVRVTPAQSASAC